MANIFVWIFKITALKLIKDLYFQYWKSFSPFFYFLKRTMWKNFEGNLESYFISNKQNNTNKTLLYSNDIRNQKLCYLWFCYLSCYPRWFQRYFWKLLLLLLFKIQILSSWVPVSWQHWRESQLWVHKFWQPSLVHADYVSVDYIGLLGECLQHGE